LKKVGIALGGGGSRGFAHLGVLKALEEKGIKPDIISGTSTGAIIGALLAADKSPDEIMEILKEIRITDIAKLGLPTNGLANLGNLRSKLDKLLDNKSFFDLKYPLHIAVSNLFTGKVEYISEGNVSKAVQASASIPILFSPVEINGQLYVDGGMLDNVPVKPLVGNCDIIVAVDIMPIEKVAKIEGVSAIFARIFEMSVGIQQGIKENCDLVIELNELAGYNILDTNHNEKVYEIGYNYVKNMDLSGIISIDQLIE